MHPSKGIGRQSTFNGLQLAKDLICELPSFNGWQNIMLTFVANDLNVCNRGRCADAECFLDSPHSKTFDQFFDGQTTFLYFHTPMTGQRDYRVACDPVQNGITQ